MPRAHVVSVRLDDQALASVDLLVRAGLASSRSEAAALLVQIGAQAAGSLLGRAERLVDDIDLVRQEFFAAVRGRDPERARELIARRPELAGSVSEDGETPMLAAVYAGAGAVFEALRAQGMEPSIFEAAAYGDRSRVAEILTVHPEAVHAHSPDGWTALHLAAHFGHREVAQLLVERGADIAVRSRNEMHNTPLNAAVFGGHVELVRWLLHLGADVNVRQKGDWTPLHRAAWLGHRDLADLLLASGADPALRTADGLRAEEIALARGHQDIVRLLSAHPREDEDIDAR